MSQVPGSIEDAINELDKYPNIKEIISLDKFRTQASKKYPNGPELVENEVSDLLIALLLSRIPLFQQNGNNAATPEGVLKNIDTSLPSFSLNDDEKKALGHKLTNLRTSSLWDTLSEILIYKTMLSNLPHHRVGIEEILGEGETKDADFALFDENGSVLVLIDAVTPQSIPSSSSATDQIVKWISRKYDSKFSNFCKSNPEAKVAVIVSLVKNEHFYMAFINKLLKNEISEINSTILDTKNGLIFGLASSFRCPDGINLIIDHLAQYQRKP